MSGRFDYDPAARSRIAQVWRHRIALFGVPRPAVGQVAEAANTTTWQVRKMLGGLAAKDGSEGGE